MEKENIIKITKNLGWRYANNSLIKTFEFDSFIEVLHWIHDILEDLTYKYKKYPSMIWEVEKITLVIFSKDKNDITENDRIFIEELEKENNLRNNTAKYL